MESETGTKRRKRPRERGKPGEVERYTGTERQERRKMPFQEFLGFFFCMKTSGTQLCWLDAGGLRELASRYKSGIDS